jgi:hypothetical protein
VAFSTVLVFAAILAASTMIASLHDRNRRLAGFRPVRITTTPGGAQVALVPLDPMTNEPYPNLDGIVRPSKTTPLTTELKAGTYLVEAVLPGNGTLTFVEVYRTVLEPDNVPELLSRRNKELGFEPDTCFFPNIKIMSADEKISDMIQIQIPEDVRKRNPSLPAQLYVDEKQTTPAALMQNPEFKQLLRMADDRSPYIRYPTALKWAEINQKRLASSAEYDAVATAVKRGQAASVKTGATVTMDDLFDDYPELSTTIRTNSSIDGSVASKQLRNMHVLKGFETSNAPSEVFPWAGGVSLASPATVSPKISIRGVRSATPRFVKP